MFKVFVNLLIITLIIFILCKSVKIIQPNHVGLKVTLGKYDNKKLEPGLHFIIPFVQQVQTITYAQIPMKLDKQVVITKDNAEVTCALSMNYHITNPEFFAFNNEDSVLSVVQQTRAQLRGIIGEKDLNDILNQTTEINSKLQVELDKLTDPYGVKVDRINIDSILPSEAVKKSMEKQLTANREAEATKQKADGEFYKITKETDGYTYETKQRADAEAYRINTVNKALSDSPASYFKDQQIKALASFAKGDSNTVIIPSELTSELSKLPVATKIVEASIKKPKVKKTKNKVETDTTKTK